MMGSLIGGMLLFLIGYRLWVGWQLRQVEALMGEVEGDALRELVDRLGPFGPPMSRCRVARGHSTVLLTPRRFGYP